MMYLAATQPEKWKLRCIAFHFSRYTGAARARISHR
jgi:hypothetical protein